jgi:hypothetical protein
MIARTGLATPAMDGFVQMNAGTMSPAEFLSPENTGAIFAAVPPNQNIQASPTLGRTSQPSTSD